MTDYFAAKAGWTVTVETKGDLVYVTAGLVDDKNRIRACMSMTAGQAEDFAKLLHENAAVAAAMKPNG